MPAKKGRSEHLPAHGPDQIGMERLIFFSDAIFAIAITLLVLDIRLPITNDTLTDAELSRLLLGIWPKYMAYGISFLVIGMFWIGHHRKFRFIQRYDNRLLLLNVLLLMVIAFTPFPTTLISEYVNRTATIFYALVMIASSLLSFAIWWYASYNGLIDPNLDQRKRRRETFGPLLVAGIFLVSIGLAYINGGVARLSWLLVAFMLRFYR